MLWCYTTSPRSWTWRFLRASLGTGPPEFKLPAPVYVRFENSPVVEISKPVRLSTSETFAGRLKYFDYGVVSLGLELQLSVIGRN